MEKKSLKETQRHSAFFIFSIGVNGEQHAQYTITGLQPV